jgi:hypothetical protein
MFWSVKCSLIGCHKAEARAEAEWSGLRSARPRSPRILSTSATCVGRIYQQTFVDTYSKVTFVKLYDRKTPITAADLLNDRAGMRPLPTPSVQPNYHLWHRGWRNCG